MHIHPHLSEFLEVVCSLLPLDSEPTSKSLVLSSWRTDHSHIKQLFVLFQWHCERKKNNAVHQPYPLTGKIKEIFQWHSRQHIWKVKCANLSTVASQQCSHLPLSLESFVSRQGNREGSSWEAPEIPSWHINTWCIPVWLLSWPKDQTALVTLTCTPSC